MFLKNRLPWVALRFWLIIAIHLTFVIWCDGQKLPCSYYDSINITAGVKHSNNSIMLNGMVFTSDQYAEIDYILKGTNAERITVKPYTRGCSCVNRPCVRLCCPYGTFEDANEPEMDIECRPDEAANNLKIDITDEHNHTQTVQLNGNFGYTDRICSNFYYADEYKINKVTPIHK